MPWDSSYRNPRLIKEFLTVNYEGRDVALNLNTCLGNRNGLFEWDGVNALAPDTCRNLDLRGSVLAAELTYNRRWHRARIDLSERIRVVNGRLVLADPNGPPAFSPPPSPTSADPPPSYEASHKFAEELREFKSSNRLTYSQRSSSYFRFSVQDKGLRLTGSTLRAECRRADGRYNISELDLNDHISILNGHLVWGRSGFFAECDNVTLDGFILKVRCKGKDSQLDLGRFLHAYDGMLGIKVKETSEELTELFSEVRWMKFKVVNEPDSEFLLELEQKAAFRTAFSAIAESTTEHVVKEVTEEFKASAAKQVKAAVTDRVKAQMTSIVQDSINKKIEEEVVEKIKTAFEIAQVAVIEACKEMAKSAADAVTHEYTEAVVGPMEEDIAKRCDQLIQEALIEVSASAIAQFQERAEIMMEREIMSASLRKAQTQANFLKLLASQIEGSMMGNMSPGV